MLDSSWATCHCYACLTLQVLQSSILDTVTSNERQIFTCYINYFRCNEGRKMLLQ